jgi:hypothetical protein
VDRSARGRAVWEAVAALAGVVAALAAVVGLVLAARSDDDDSEAAGAEGATTTQAGGGEGTDGGGGTGGSTTDTTAGGGSAESTTTTSDEPGPDLGIFLEGRCDIVGGGALSGLDVLNIYLRVRNVGEVTYDGVVRTEAVSDSGLVGGATHGVQDGAASVALQVDLAPQDYGRTHEFEVETTATEDLDETDRSNNAATIEIPLPSSPPGPGRVIEPC